MDIKLSGSQLATLAPPVVVMQPWAINVADTSVPVGVAQVTLWALVTTLPVPTPAIAYVQNTGLTRITFTLGDANPPNAIVFGEGIIIYPGDCLTVEGFDISRMSAAAIGSAAGGNINLLILRTA